MVLVMNGYASSVILNKELIFMMRFISNERNIGSMLEEA